MITQVHLQTESIVTIGLTGLNVFNDQICIELVSRAKFWPLFVLSFNAFEMRYEFNLRCSGPVNV